MFTAALFTRAKTWQQPSCPPTDGWIKKVTSIYRTEYYALIKKDGILTFAAMWLELEIIMLSGISQAQEEKYHVLSLTHGTKKSISQKFRVWWLPEAGILGRKGWEEGAQGS
jgi:hypothetical protein